MAFRNESLFYPPGSEPTGVYRQVLFPTKVQLDLSYYPHRTLFTDCLWMLRGVLAVVGMYKNLATASPRALEQALTGSSAGVGGTSAAPGFTGQT